jgi:hypothetical protein
MKNNAQKSAVQISATPNKYCNLKTSKMGKTWHFIFDIVDTLKQLYCDIKRTQKEDKKKI